KCPADALRGGPTEDGWLFVCDSRQETAFRDRGTGRPVADPVGSLLTCAESVFGREAGGRLYDPASCATLPAGQHDLQHMARTVRAHRRWGAGLEAADAEIEQRA